MLKIDEGKIYLTRGDTAYLEVAITLNDGSLYSMGPADKLRFSVKKNIADSEYAFQKVTQGSNLFTIDPVDTNGLDTGKYWYDVELETAIGEIFTVIEKSGFYLREEVTEE